MGNRKDFALMLESLARLDKKNYADFPSKERRRAM